MRSDIEKLRAARELIARPGGWTTEVCARDASGWEVDECEDSAVCFCMTGAMERVGWSQTAVRLLAKAMPSDETGIPRWNDADGRTQAEVVAAFDRAIALAEAGHV